MTCNVRVLNAVLSQPTVAVPEGLHVIAFDAQSLVLASEELREQFSGGIKLAS